LNFLQIDIPAIALTAYGRVEHRYRALEAGYQMHAAKPVKREELVSMILDLSKETQPM